MSDVSGSEPFAIPEQVTKHIIHYYEAKRQTEQKLFKLKSKLEFALSCEDIVGKDRKEYLCDLQNEICPDKLSKDIQRVQCGLSQMHQNFVSYLAKHDLELENRLYPEHLYELVNKGYK